MCTVENDDLNWAESYALSDHQDRGLYLAKRVSGWILSTIAIPIAGGQELITLYMSSSQWWITEGKLISTCDLHVVKLFCMQWSHVDICCNLPFPVWLIDFHSCDFVRALKPAQYCSSVCCTDFDSYNIVVSYYTPLAGTAWPLWWLLCVAVTFWVPHEIINWCHRSTKVLPSFPGTCSRLQTNLYLYYSALTQ